MLAQGVGIVEGDAAVCELSGVQSGWWPIKTRVGRTPFLPLSYLVDEQVDTCLLVSLCSGQPIECAASLPTGKSWWSSVCPSCRFKGSTGAMLNTQTEPAAGDVN